VPTDIPRMGLPDRLAARLSIAEQHALLLSRRTLLTGAAAAAATMAVGSGPAAAFWRQADTPPGRMVVPFGRHLAWGANPRTTVSVGWQVPHRVRRPFLRVDAFTTAPSRRTVAEPFTFTAFGDQGVSSHALANDGMLIAQRPAFHLHAGDLCYADASGKGLPGDLYDPRTWDQFLAQNEPVAATVPWMACLGNHDMEALYSPDGYGGQRARWDFPDNGPEKAAGVYSFVYGNVGVVALDANDVCLELAGNRDYTGGAARATPPRSPCVHSPRTAPRSTAS